MKFAVVGDIHISDTAPSTRKDDYKSVVLGKLEFIINWVNAVGDHSAILLVGDVFDKKKPSSNSHSMVASLITLFEKSTVPIYVIPGNHDIRGNMSEFDKQPLNVLIQSGVVNLLDGQTPVLFDNDDIKVSLNGIHFTPAMDTKAGIEMYSLPHAESDIKISMFHQMILPDGVKYPSDYVNFSDLKDINADVIISGHYHGGYSPSMITTGNYEKHFINGGAITRGTADQANFDKVPKFLSLVIENNGAIVPTVQAFDINIPFVDANEVFDFTVIDRNKKKKDLHKFMDSLSEMENQSLTTQEPGGIINALRALGMDQRLVSIAQQYLENAYAELS